MPRLISMKKVMILVIVGILLLNIITFFSSIGICQETSSKILYVGGTGDGSCTSIQDAINASERGDMVIVYSGTYYENIVIDKSIDLISENRGKTIIEGDINISVNATAVVNFTINGSIVLRGSTEGLFSSTSFYNNSITNNFITNGRIFLDSEWGSFVNISISGNTIDYGRIYSAGTFYKSIIYENILSNSWCGINLRHAHYNNITNNVITNINGTGIILQEFGTHNNISNNNIINNDGNGIYLAFSKDNVISNNIIKNNKNGIYLEFWNTENIITENILIENDNYGIYYGDPGSFPNNDVIYRNSFIDNVLGNAYETSDNSDVSNNSWYNVTVGEGNYWEDYMGIDDDGDGIGDIPYNIPDGDNQDKYPLMTPYKGEISKEKHDDGIDTSFIYPMLIIGMIVAIIFCLPIAYYWRKKWFS